MSFRAASHEHPCSVMIKEEYITTLERFKMPSESCLDLMILIVVESLPNKTLRVIVARASSKWKKNRMKRFKTVLQESSQWL